MRTGAKRVQTYRSEMSQEVAAFDHMAPMPSSTQKLPSVNAPPLKVAQFVSSAAMYMPARTITKCMNQYLYAVFSFSSSPSSPTPARSEERERERERERESEIERERESKH